MSRPAVEMRQHRERGAYGGQGERTWADMLPWPSSSGTCPKALIVLDSARNSIWSTRSSTRSIESSEIRSPISRAIARSVEFGRNGPDGAGRDAVLDCLRGMVSR